MVVLAVLILVRVVVTDAGKAPFFSYHRRIFCIGIQEVVSWGSRRGKGLVLMEGGYHIGEYRPIKQQGEYGEEEEEEEDLK